MAAMSHQKVESQVPRRSRVPSNAHILPRPATVAAHEIYAGTADGVWNGHPTRLLAILRLPMSARKGRQAFPRYRPLCYSGNADPRLATDRD